MRVYRGQSFFWSVRFKFIWNFPAWFSSNDRLQNSPCEELSTTAKKVLMAKCRFESTHEQWNFSKMVQCVTPLISNRTFFPFRLNNTYIALYTTVGTLIVATIYLQLIQNRYMFRSFTLLQCSHQHCVQPVASDVEVVRYL